MNRKGLGRKQMCQNLRHYTGICPERLRKTMENVTTLGVPADNRNECLLNTCINPYCYTIFLATFNLFICSLFYDAVYSTNYTQLNSNVISELSTGNNVVAEFKLLY
jgi:hypothetical protein